MTATQDVAIGMHEGQVLMRLAKNYPDVPRVVSEVVGNSIDSGATRVDVEVNLAKRQFTVCDDGSGASREKFTEALQSIGITLKHERHKYGQFGLGLISPLCISDEHTFETCPAPRVTGYVEYLFVTKDIVKLPKVSIPWRALGLTHDPVGKVWWRTRVTARKITGDRRASSTTALGLSDDIAIKYGEEIRRRNIAITVTVQSREGKEETIKVVAPEFSGTSIEPYEDSKKECGKVRVELYLARLMRTGRRGSVVFMTMNNPSRITGKQFVQCAKNTLESQVANALLSGLFEGRVLCEKVVMHSDRDRFEDTDALFAFCEALEGWYKSVGKKHMEEAKEREADSRFQRIGSAVMPFAKSLVKQKKFEMVASQISVGTVGRGHARPKGKDVITTEEATAIATGGNPFDEREPRKSGGNGSATDVRIPAKKERPEHRPGIIYGPRGRRRTEVKGSSTGLRLEHVELEDFRIPYDYDPETGMLTINIVHPNWMMCQETDEYLTDYHIAVVTSALTVELFRAPEGHIHPDIVKFAHEALSQQAFAIYNSRALLAK